MATGDLYRSLSVDSSEDWDRLPDNIRLGLTYSEFLQIRDKYSGVIAVPIFDRDKTIRGCVALDSVASEPFASLAHDGTYDVLIDAAVAIGRDLSNLPSWVYPPGEELRDA
jgi:hypothetical protein